MKRMLLHKKVFLLYLILLVFVNLSQAQKKLVPVSTSSLTGITLPPGSKKDGRFLSESLGKTLLEMETKKVNASVKTVEILSLPTVATSGFSAESMVNQFVSQGWTMTPCENDDKFAWLKKDNRCVLAFFSVNKNSTDLYFGEVDNFNNIQSNPNTEIVTTTTTTVQANNSSVPYQSDYTYNTTNFDDGWTSVIKEDWIEVSKGDLKVYLLYALPYNGSDFSGTGLVARDYYWDNYITKYFTVQTKQYNDNGEVIGSFKPDYVEGWAADKQTGEKRFIAMRLSIAPNTAYLTIASAKDEASLRQQFPKANEKYVSGLANMDGYNKFAISEKDIMGTWQNGNTSTAQWYYVTPGGYDSYAGMSVAATSATFNFSEGGNYTSVHNGATGMVGAMSTFQQNYKGKYTVTDWIINATNRWEGKTEKFDAWFKIIRGGRILQLKGSGVEYSLLKVK